MQCAAISSAIDLGGPFAWLPVHLIAQAVETADRLGMPVTDIEGRHRELILHLTAGTSVHLIVADEDAAHAAALPKP